MPATSAFTFKDNKLHDHIRSQLPDVQYVLDGVVSISPGNSLRITAELWETHFFVLVSLMAVDHPAGTEVFVDERFAVPAPPLKKVEIEGLISAKGNDSIVVNGQQIIVPSACPIRHGQTRLTFADLHLNDRVHVRANRAALLEATELILQNPGDGEGSGDDAPTTLVSVTATDGNASESPIDTGTFTLTRSGTVTSPSCWVRRPDARTARPFHVKPASSGRHQRFT